MGDKPDELAAAERAVVEAAVGWVFSSVRGDPEDKILATVHELLRLRAAQASQGSGG